MPYDPQKHHRQCLNLGECHSPLLGVVMNGDLVDFWWWAIAL
jgi:hypothetical protein